LLGKNLETNKETAAARERLCKHVPAATDTHATIEKLLETIFFAGPYQEDLSPEAEE
jgi:hypothetical protein